MIKVDPVLWGIATAWGAILGTFYFGGLWWTLKTLYKKARPGLWLLASFLVRALLALAGFLPLIRKDLISFVFAFLAFMAMRFFIGRIVRLKPGGADNAN